MQPAGIIQRSARLTGNVWRFARGPVNVCVELPDSGRVFIAGAGKAAVPFARALAASLHDRLTSGLIVTKTGHAAGEPDPRIEVVEASHPVPDERSVDAAVRLETFLHQLTMHDVLFFLVTGGASALLAAPVPGITLADKQAVTRLLLDRGADIHAINCVRKHLSRLKGGGVLRCAGGARVITLAVSDVIGDEPSSIGSGLTVADPGRFSDALEVAQRFGLDRDAPAAVLLHLREGAAGARAETLKPGAAEIARSEFHILACLDQSLDAAEMAGVAEGFDVFRLPEPLQGPVEICARNLINAVDRIRNEARRRWLIVAGGEPEVKVGGHGSGGRNQHLALLLACALQHHRGVHGLVAGTDGTDGPTQAAGAGFSAETLHGGRRSGLDATAALQNFDSARYLNATGDQFVTGPTGTNVMDIMLISGPAGQFE